MSKELKRLRRASNLPRDLQDRLRKASSASGGWIISALLCDGFSGNPAGFTVTRTGRGALRTTVSAGVTLWSEFFYYDG